MVEQNMLDRYGEGLYALVMTRGSLAIGYAAIVVAAVLWGGSIVAQKLALSGFSAVEASVLRDMGGLVILIITWFCRPSPDPIGAPSGMIATAPASSNFFAAIGSSAQ